jgi:hypothetical protein
MEKRFKFYSEYNLHILLGISAKNVNELLENLKTIPGGSVYFHTHRFLIQHLYLVPEPPNDFAYWLRNTLNLRELSEHISSIDIASAKNIEDLRLRLINAIEKYPNKQGYSINCTPGDEFRFMTCKTFCLPLQDIVSDTDEFLEVIQRVTVNSLYYHIFGAELRMGKARNDFAEWFDLIGETELSDKLSAIDPYTTTLEGLRNKIIELVKKYGKSQ